MEMKIQRGKELKSKIKDTSLSLDFLDVNKLQDLDEKFFTTLEYSIKSIENSEAFQSNSSKETVEYLCFLKNNFLNFKDKREEILLCSGCNSDVLPLKNRMSKIRLENT
jgi:hypothetical protein